MNVELETKVVTIVVGDLSAVSKAFEKGLEELLFRGRIETIQTAALLTSARILRNVLET